MKEFAKFAALSLMVLFAMACGNLNTEEGALETKGDPGLRKNWFFWENKIDKTQTNQYKSGVFCHDWKFVSTEVEIWDEGRLVEMKEVSNIFPYRDLKIQKDGSMSADGMKGIWDYKYNNLMIDVSTSGGSNYLYQVVEVKGGRMILREEEYNIGGPIVTFLQDPLRRHTFCRYTYVKQ